MDGKAKRILIVVLAAVLVVSSLAIMAAVRKSMESETPENVIKASLNVGNPVRDLDKNGDMKADYAEVSVDASEHEANELVDSDHDGSADSQEVGEEQEVAVPEENDGNSALLASQDDGGNADNRSLLNAPNLTDMRMMRDLFQGYGRNIMVSKEKGVATINAGIFVKRAVYDIPKPDMRWIRESRKIARNVDPSMYFGDDGFNGTSVNYTSIRHMEKRDADHDGNPEYFKLVEYSNLTQDINDDGVADVLVIHYHELLFYDNNSDGNHEYQKWIRVFAYLEDRDANGYYERKVVQAIGGVYYDNNSDGNREYFKAYAVGNQTVDDDQNGVYEFHLAMLGFAERYDNNSNGNAESVRALFGVKAILDENQDGMPEYMGASVTGYLLKDENDDGNAENEKFLHWRYMKDDKDSNGVYEDVRGIAAYANYYDNNSDGNHEYGIAAIKGVSYRDVNQNGRAENGIVGYAYCTVRDENSDGNNESEVFRMAIVNGTDNDENDIYEHAWKLYVTATYYDNNSDGNPEYRHFLMAGWVISDENQDRHYEHAGIVFVNLTMRDSNSDGNPDARTSRMFYREVWDTDDSGIYERERGIAEIGYRYDNNSNGVVERASLKAYGYTLRRSEANGNVTNITLVVICSNATNEDDSGVNEWENFTMLVITKHDADADGNPEYVHVWIVKHHQYLEFNDTANATWLYNVTFVGVYEFKDANDNGLRDSWVLRGMLTTHIDYDLDGTWDYVDSTTVYRQGSDE